MKVAFPTDDGVTISRHLGQAHLFVVAALDDSGQPAYDRAVAEGLNVILTGERTIADALKAYQAGTLVTDMRRVHAHMGAH